MILQTQRLTLRPFTMRDLRTTHAYASDPDNTRYMLNLPNNKKRRTKQFLRCVVADWERKPQRRFEFAVTLGGKHIGAVSVTLEDNGRTGELGWIIRKTHWGKGYATEAAAAVMQFARVRLGVTRCTARCDARNAASARVMEKLGMVPAGEGVRVDMESGETGKELVYAIEF